MTPHKTELQSYFDGVGFDRWSAIYGNVPVSRIRRTVREGHWQMLTQAKSWLIEHPIGSRLLDAGCGTGLFSLTMASRGFDVTGVDIAPRMVEAAASAAQEAGLAESINFVAGDIESINERFDMTACFDVLVHYPQGPFVRLTTALAERTEKTLLLTYAPYSRLFAFLHWVGGHFPQGNRRTTIQMTPDAVVVETLAKAGMHIRRSTCISHGFYHVKLVEAVRG
jgi:magnesium-protoporphyrin O-methyltransferase